VNITTVRTARAEGFYWVTIMFSQTLGTALGDWTADSAHIGYAGGIAIFAGLLALTALAYFFTRANRTALFWIAFVLTRPLGAVVGDFLDKPLNHGGLDLSRYAVTGLLLVAIVVLVALLPQRAAHKAH
jgi:uncharacterized membrane-anchored protein